MSKIFQPDLSPEDRVRVLHDNCDKVEETKYLKPLSQDELDQRREQLAENSIKVYDMEDELTNIKSGFKKRIDPLKSENKVLLRQIKTKQEEIEGTLFHIANHEDGMMETYDDSGELVSSRRLRPEEKQARLFPLKKAQ